MVQTSRQELLTQLAVAKQNLAQAQSTVKDLEKQVLSIMETEQRKTLSATVGESKYRITYVRSSTVSVDEAGLKKALGARAWNTLTDRKFSRKKLEAALENDKIEVEKVTPFLTEKHGSAYLRISESSAADTA